MKTRISGFDAGTGMVRVTFSSGKIRHCREVVACLTPTGEYDPGATQRRVADVARGVAAKIAVGLIS